MGNRGAIDWTVGKLLSMILLVTVLVLVAYGISTKGLNPLIDRVGVMMDGILILLNIRDNGAGDEECYSPDVASLSEGEGFLNNLGVAPGDSVVKIDICKNNICTLNIGNDIGIYRLNNGVFEKKVGEDWREFKDERFIQKLVHGGFNYGYNVVITDEQLKTAFWKTYNTVEIEGIEYLAKIDSDDSLEIDVGTLKSSNLQNLNLEGLFIKKYITTKEEKDPFRYLYVEELDISKKEKYGYVDMERDKFYNSQQKKYLEDLNQWNLIEEFIRSRCK
jgi:hypothetical protein